MSSPAELLARYTGQAEISSFFIDKIGQIWVSAYGTVGDGVTDDTLAVQAAVDAAIANGSDEVYFVSGKTYKITSLTSTTGITFLGNNVTITGGSTITVQSLTSHLAESTPHFLDINIKGSPYNAVGDGTDISTGLLAAIAVAAALSRKARIFLPPGDYTVHGISFAYDSCSFIGAGVGLTRITHADGYAEPLFDITGADGANEATAYYGFSGITFIAGSMTTDILYYAGRIDNHTEFYDLQFQAAANATCNGISVLDYLNWHMERIRFDSIGGWGIEVRDGKDFTFCSFSLSDWTYDNYKAGDASRGQGLFYLDCSGVAQPKGTVSFTDGTAEIRLPLASSKPERSMIRIVQNTTYTGATGAQVSVNLENISWKATHADGKDMKIVSTNDRDISLSCRNITSYYANQFYNNDAGDAKNAILGSTGSIVTINESFSDEMRYPMASLLHASKINGVNFTVYNSDASLVDTSTRYRRGDICISLSPLNAAGNIGRTFCYKAIQPVTGFCTGAVIAVGTGTIDTGTAIIQLTADIPSTVVPGMSLDIPGAGAAAATLQAMVISVDYSTDQITINTNASTTATGVAVTTTVAILATVDMIFYGTTAPAAGTYNIGDKILNSSPSRGEFTGWQCVTAGTPGTWIGYGQLGANKNTTASRPTKTTVGVNDDSEWMGYLYLDTTIDADGKPIWWNGAAWVDATGATV